MVSRRNWVIVFGMVAFLVTGCGSSPTKIQEPAQVRVTVVGAKAAGGQSNYAGEVRSRYQTALAFQVGGRIARRLVDVGTAVRAGDALMVIDEQDVRLGAGRAEAQLRAAQTDADLAQANYARYSALYRQAAVSKADYDRMANMRDSALARLDDANNAYTAAARQLDYTTLTADKPGVVVEIDAEVGQVVAQGQQVMVLARSGEKEVEINVPEQALGEFEHAGDITVTFWAFPDLAVKGRVREIAPAADRVTRTYRVEISLIDPPEKVKLGMTAEVRVKGAKQDKEIYLPLSALIQTDNQPGVWLVKDGSLVRQPVKVGKFGDNRVQIVEGLKTGDAVVTAGVHKLNAGQKVRIWDGSGAQ